METLFDTARPEDYDEVIDLGNYVFSHAHKPHDFPSMLPKLYRREYFADSIHYLAREGGKIKAMVGAYPLEWEFSGLSLPSNTLPGRGIGMVSVHPYSRSRGYMKKLMNMALDDMRRDGIVFSCLSGRRQRYEYFGYTPVGTAYTFICNEENMRHTLGPQSATDLSLRPVGPGDASLLDRIQSLHEAKRTRLRRQRERLFDILSSWYAHVFAVIEGERFEGYFIFKGGKNGEALDIIEINLFDLSRLPEVLDLFMRESNSTGVQLNATPSGLKTVRVAAGPHEAEKIAVLSHFAETYTQNPAYLFAVFDYPRFIEPFLKLKAMERNLMEGSVIFQIEGGPRLHLAAGHGAASITETTERRADEPAELCLNRLELLHFLFSPLAIHSFPAIRKSAFLQSLLPLPLFFENADAI